LTTDAPTSERTIVLWICVFLAAITLAVFGQTWRYEFVNFDDDVYVYQNPEVSRGLTLKGAAEAFNYSHSDNWIPLTTLSHSLDCQLFGLDAGGHHVTNVLLHTASVILLFLVLRRMTGTLWRAAFVAAVFAIHPLRVESVAWVSERKDVLSGLFFMLALWAYQKNVECRVQNAESKKWKWAVLVFFVLGLMSKPMLVTLPFALLLLDYWPLKRSEEWRVESGEWKRLVIEKWGLFGLALALCLVTVFAQGHHHAIASVQHFSMPARIENALVSYVTYIGQMFYPAGLAAYYPRSETGFPILEVIAAFLLLAVISLGVLLRRRTSPYLLVGWLWYLGMLAPVIGLVQVGDQARADRYTYLPQIGLYVMVAWGVAQLSEGWRHRRVVLGGASAIVIGALALCAHLQVSYWKDPESLWTHTLACTTNNYFAHNNLGTIYVKKGQVDKAMEQFQKTVELTPGDAHSRFNLGNIYLRKGELDRAIAQFRKAAELQPDDARTRSTLGKAYLHKGKVDEAVAQFQKTVELTPNDASAQYDLGDALVEKGKVAEAAAHYPKAFEIGPGFVETNVVIQNNLAYIAWVLATSPDTSIRSGAKAIEIARQTDRAAHGTNPMVIGALAAGYAEAGRFSEAVATVRLALRRAGDQNNTELVTTLQKQLKSYQEGLPYREVSPP